VLGEIGTLQIVVLGKNFSAESRVFLREIPRGTSQRDIAKAKIITPSRIQASRDLTMLVLTVDASLFKASGYEIHIINPGEFQTSQGIFLAKKPPAGQMFFAALGYSPFFPLSQSVLFENFPQKFFPAGAYGRFGIVPFKFTWGNLGADFSAFVDFLSHDWPDFQQRAWMLQTHLNALYQKKLLDTLVFNARLGGGITSLLDFRYIYDDGTSDGFNSFYISASGEASAQWFPFKSNSFAGNLFAEAGFRISAVFMPEEAWMNYLGITVGFGAKF
jgi:hypothetical protein